MNKLIFTLALFFSTLQLFGQNIEGTWSGQLDVRGQKFRLIFKIDKQDSLYIGTMGSPDQGAKGISLSKIDFNGSDLLFEIERPRILYKGTMQCDTLIKGMFIQAGATFPLLLTRGEIVINRPQEPHPPYPYNVEEVSFASLSPHARLAGTLTYPQGGTGKYPVAILVSGSGAHDRNVDIFGHKPFHVIADYLTRNGIAVLRYDDRGVGESTGDYASATSKDFAEDAAGAFEYLLSRPEIDADKIGIIGHSEGGMIAFMAAADNIDPSFIVALGSPGLRGDSILLWQARAALQEGYPSAVVDRYCLYLSEVYKKSEVYTPIMNDNLLSGELRQALLAIITTLDNSPWFDYFVNCDPATYLERVDCPVFILNGEKDTQIEAISNTNAIRTALDRGQNTKYTTIIYPGLNHLFQECETGLMSEYAQIEQTISPVVLENMVAWIKKVVR